MPKDRASKRQRVSIDELARNLAQFSAAAASLEPVKPERKRRPKALTYKTYEKWIADGSKQRHFGLFMKAVAETNSRRRTTKSSEIAHSLMMLTEYRHIGHRQLRRDVSEVVTWALGILNETPDHLWKELLYGMDPPLSRTRKLMREKAFEFLRGVLQDHLARQT
jgi:hypothetical protein